MKQHSIRFRLRAAIAVGFALTACASFAPQFSAQQRVADPAIPLGLPADTWAYYVPKRNPLTAAKVELGRKLFFDARLSADGKVSCATCHDPKLGFADGKPVAEGIGGRRGPRNSPTLLNVMFNAGQFWDGRADTLEEQAVLPLINPLEMGEQSHADVIARLRGTAEYVDDFRRVFSGAPTIERVGQAIAAFERTLIAGNAPFDRFNAGDRSAISAAAQRGFALFRGKGRCSRCHTFSDALPFFTDFAYHNTGVSASHPQFEKLAQQAFVAAEGADTQAAIDRLGRQEGGHELGRVLFSYTIFDIGSYRTPSLRNIALTAPYFHDGSAPTLADVVRFYNDGGRANINREWDLNPLGLTDDEQRDLIALLESLTGRTPPVEAISRQRR